MPTLGSLSIGGSSYSNASTKERKKKDKKDKKEKKKYCKEDIGLPTNFQHLHHVGWNSAGTIDFQLKQVLEEAGVSTHQYKNPETKQFIDNFVQQYTQTTGQDLGRAKESADYGNQLSNYGNSSYNGGAYMQSMRYNSQKSNGPPPLPQSQPTYTYYPPNQGHRGSVDNSSNNLSNNVNNQTYVSKPINPAPPVPGGPTANSYKSQAPPPPPLPNHLANAAGKSAPGVPPPPPLPGNLSGKLALND